MCDCIKVSIDADEGPETFNLESSGTLNGKNYWEFTYGGVDFAIYWTGGSCWVLAYGTSGSGSSLISRYCPSSGDLCGTGSPVVMSVDTASNDTLLRWNWFGNPEPYPIDNVKSFSTEGIDCPTCGHEDRTNEKFMSIKLPETFTEEDRGVKECCCKYKVLASTTSTDSWKNDITSAWIKTSDSSDTFTFKLYKDGALTTYTPTNNQFPSDSLAYYTTIHWRDVLSSDGIGCYKLEIEYSISGITGSLTWGEYELQTYSIQNALKTARVRVLFNGVQEVQDIDFTGSDVESTFRFNGYIGNRQPNMETDNIIYNNREMKRVTRENLNSYEIITDPSDDCIIRPLVNLYLLSENEMFISDYNAHNPSYRYQDIPVIVSESPTLEYFDLSRKVSLKCIVTDKFKNKRTYY